MLLFKTTIFPLVLKMNKVFRSLFLSTLLMFSMVASGKRIYSVDEVLAIALANNQGLKADTFGIVQQLHLKKSAFNIPAPEFFWESPTGNFYTGSITQSMDFPLVYVNQLELQKRKLRLAIKQYAANGVELNIAIRTIYLQLQLDHEKIRLSRQQDSLLGQIAKAADLQFQNGQIDYLQKLYAEQEYVEATSKFSSSLIEYNSNKEQLGLLAGISEEFDVLSLQKLELPGILFSDSELSQNKSLDVLIESERISEYSIRLEKNKLLPGVAFGYFNQGERTTPLQNRFRFGLTIPLWLWQYKGNIQAAKAEHEVNKFRTNDFRQKLSIEHSKSIAALKKKQAVLDYYEARGQRYADEILNVAPRLHQAGVTDLISFLRSVSEAFKIREQHAEAVAGYNESILQLKFLNGQL